MKKKKLETGYHESSSGIATKPGFQSETATGRMRPFSKVGRPGRSQPAIRCPFTKDGRNSLSTRGGIPNEEKKLKKGGTWKILDRLVDKGAL
ncbi:hypothetical protein WN55_05213 [Dufourea novaeangliae]|uniref:Uncharacterized protein n=1 Tax=Dufourea novaeangliae TaxID=178035 RepID=A0A154PRB9_DUFNO|nr:hypothetical protein WN55_05213 [Dufourea novaeangliae]